ncbi:uncharacterized protein LOC133393715 [Anopheles gambiae]|nr:uncharacterized protein LOC133393715 [Anopheles gambiae]XP_061515763.1 uncharacterized protein LOC133393715 [Anopheles gambiae]
MDPAAKKPKLENESANSSYHGMFYHLRLGMVILLHSYNLHRKGTLPHLSITMEDCEAGKFDDIVIRYASSTTPKGTIYIQAKHKLSSENTKPLTEGDFFTKKASSTPFSIPMYFRSYLDHYRPASNGSHAYLLCTNATIDDKMMQYFTQRHYDVSDILSFCDLINATCYSFKREGKFTALFKDLRRVSLEKLGKLLATHAKTGEEINSNDTLIRLYHNLIAMSVERVTSNVFRFKREFWTAHAATPMGRLRIIVEREYGKLPQNKPKEEAIQLTISNASNDFPNAAANPGAVDQFCFEQIDRIIHQFCDEFLLVCGSKSESNLLSDAHELMPNWVRDRKGTFENLQTLLLEALRGEGSSTITLKQLKEKYIEVNANESFNMLRVLTQEHIQSVRNEYPFIELQEDRLKDSSLYRFIGNSSSLDVHCFFTKHNVNVSSIIIAQASALQQYDCIFVNGSSSQVKGNIREILRDVMEFLFDVDRTSRYIFVIFGQIEPDELKFIQELTHKYKVKSILIQQLFHNNLYEDRFFVRDLTEAAAVQVLQQQGNFNIFGTTIALNKVVGKDDTLGFLCDVLERCNQNLKSKTEYCNRKCYESISRWYIPRTMIPYKKYKGSSRTYQDLFYVTPKIAGTVIPFQNLEFMQPNSPSIIKSYITSQDGFKHIANAMEQDEYTKVCLILDEAGVGKSTFFIALAFHLSNDNPAAFVIRMIALNYSTDFARLKTIDPTTMDDTTIVRIFFRLFYLTLFVANVNSRSIKQNDLIREQADQIAGHFTIWNGQVTLDADNTRQEQQMTVEQRLVLRLFAEKFNQRQFLLLLDGFDEIAPHYKTFVMQYFARLASLAGIRRLYLSSRPYDFVDEMKHTFIACKLFHLEEFTVRDRICFLHNFFMAEMVEFSECNERDRLLLLAVLDMQVVHKMRDAISIPLFLYMGSITLALLVRKCVNFSDETLSLEIFDRWNFSMLQMIQNFVERKLKILDIDKTGATDAVSFNAAQIQITDEVNYTLLQRHFLLAVWVMFDKAIRAQLLSGHELQEASQYIEYLAEAKEKAGIIMGVQDDVPMFKHRMFAEYFAACWLRQNRDRVKQLSYFRSRSYWIKETFQIRDFFDRLVLEESPGCELHMAVINRWEGQITQILAKNPSAMMAKDALGRIPLHLAATRALSLYTIGKSSINFNEFINVKDDLYQWRAIDYALISESDWLYFMEKNATIHIDTLLQQISFNTLDRVLHDLCFYKNKLVFQEKQEIADQLVLAVVTYLLNEKQLDIYTRQPELNDQSVIEFCTRHNMVDALKQFESHTNNRKQLPSEEYDRLFNIAVEHNACDVTDYYITECNAVFPGTVRAKEKLIFFVKYYIENDKLSSCKVFFQLLCSQLDIPRCPLEDSVMEEEDTLDQPKYNKVPEQFDTDFDNTCCAHISEAADLSLPEYNEDDSTHEGYVIETLLARAVYAGNVRMVREIVQKTQTTINNRLILTIMRLLPFGGGRTLTHERSVPGFRYLLDHSADLYSIDEQGRNLLHITAQYGCIYMVQCLLLKGFDLRERNAVNGWDALNYAAVCSAFRAELIAPLLTNQSDQAQPGSSKS